MTKYVYHYTYIIQHIWTNNFYIGRRSTNLLPAEDIGKCYFSSSSNKEFIAEQKLYPARFDYTVVNVFFDITDALEDEIRLHNLYNVGSNSLSYNKVAATHTKFNATGYKFTEQQRKNCSQRAKGRIISQKQREQVSKKLKGRQMSEKTKLLIKRAFTGKPKSLLVQDLCRARSRKISEEYKEGYYRVTRIQDKKIMNLGRFILWEQELQGYNLICRIDTKKVITIAQFTHWANGQGKIPATDISVSRILDRKCINLKQFKTWNQKIDRAKKQKPLGEQIEKR